METELVVMTLKQFDEKVNAIIKRMTWSNNVPHCDSLWVAEEFDKRHDNVLQGIEKILERNKRFGLDKLDLLTFQEISYVDERGRTYTKYLMSEQGFLELTLGFTGDKAYVLRKIVAAGFLKAYKKKKSRPIPRIEWAPERIELAEQWPTFTDTVKKIIDLAKIQDPEGYQHNCKFIYSQYASLQHICLGYPFRTKNFRDSLSKNELSHLKSVELLLVRRLNSLIDSGMFYRNIYNELKKYCIALEQIFSPTKELLSAT